MTVTTMNPPGTFSWVELGTTDGKKARDFYSQLFDWDVRETPMGPDFSYYIFHIDGKDVAAMYQFTPDQLKMNIPPNWLSYVSVADADASCTRATELGGKVVMGPHDAGDYGRMAILTDPQGATFAFWQAKSNPGIGTRGEPGSLVWNELVTSDVNAATHFYSTLLDWTTTVMPMTGMDYTVFEREGKGVGGGMQVTPDMGAMPPMWLPYFAVADCEAAAKRVKELGGRVMREPTDIPDVGPFAVCMDPTGAGFMLLEPRPS